MAASVHDNVLDAALNYIKANSTKLTVCNAQPTTFTEATATFKLASVVINSTDFGSPTNGDVSGRKVTVNAQTSVSIDSTGDAIWVALVKSSGSQLTYATDTTTTGLTSGGKVNVGEWDAEILDPT